MSYHSLNTLVCPDNKDILHCNHRTIITSKKWTWIRHLRGTLRPHWGSDSWPGNSFISKRSSSESSVAFSCHVSSVSFGLEHSRVFLYLPLPWHFWRLQTSFYKKKSLLCWVFAAGLFSCCREWGLLWGVLASAFHGFSCSGAQALGIVGLSSCGSQAREPRLSSCDAKGLVAPQHGGSSWIRKAPQHGGSSWIRTRTSVSCIGRQMLYHWTTREAPDPLFYTNPLTGVCLAYPHGSWGYAPWQKSQGWCFSLLRTSYWRFPFAPF